MKIFKYRCNKCGSEYEVKTTARGTMSSGTDSGLDLSCPNCHSDDIKKVFTPIDFKMKE